MKSFKKITSRLSKKPEKQPSEIKITLDASCPENNRVILRGTDISDMVGFPFKVEMNNAYIGPTVSLNISASQFKEFNKSKKDD